MEEEALPPGMDGAPGDRAKRGGLARGGTRQALLAHMAMLLFALFVSTSFTVGAAISGPLAPLPLTFVRFVMAGAILLGVIVAARQWRLPSLREALTSLLLAVSVTGYFVAMFEALLLTSALSTGAIFALVPLMTAGLSAVMLRQRVNGQLGLGLLVAAAGTVWVVFGGSLERMRGFHLGAGEWIFLAGCAAYAAYSPLIRLLDRGTASLLVSFWTMLASVGLIGIFAGPSMLATDWAAVPGHVYLGIVHLAVFSTAASFFLIQYASTRLPQAKVMAYTYLVPAFILLTDGLVSGRWPPAQVQAGVAVIAMAMLALQRA